MVKRLRAQLMKQSNAHSANIPTNMTENSEGDMVKNPPINEILDIELNLASNVHEIKHRDPNSDKIKLSKSSAHSNPSKKEIVDKKNLANSLGSKEEKKVDKVDTKKRKHRQLTSEEDPMQYHAKPRDLIGVSNVSTTDISTIEQSQEQMQILPSEAKIFSRTTFQSLNLDERLLKSLSSKVEEGGFGLTTSTYVQSAVLPILINDKQNVIIKSQTGSGKTLSYLIPIINDFIQRSPPIQRSDGTRALILSPTRELCSQILSVLNKLVKSCVWIVGGSLSGGEKKKSEKARLRKGISVLVSTPGRLLDHLKTTESFNLKNLQWVVLDEADRLLDMGFEKTVIEVFSLIRGQTGSASEESHNPANKLTANLTRRHNIQKSIDAKRSSHASSLCHIFASATLTKAITTQLAGPIMAASKFLVIDADKEKIITIANGKELHSLSLTASKEDGELSHALLKKRSLDFTGNDDEDTSISTMHINPNKKTRLELNKDEVVEAPEQLAQYFMMVTCKWRLAALISFLRTHQHQKVIVFFSTCDSVDFHSLLLRQTEWPTDLDPSLDDHGDNKNNEVKGLDSSYEKKREKRILSQASANVIEPLPIKFTGMLGKTCNIFRLHGNMPQNLRQEVFEAFAASTSGILLCTDVAARGLDLPRVDWILQYDPPCETTDYVHRIGRTARRGHGGSSLIFLLPAEANYIHLLQSHSLSPQALSLLSLFTEVSKLIPGSLKFKNIDEMAAVILQRRLERTVSANKHLTSAAQQAFRSFTRAYATHSADTKSIFKVSTLHLGHVAKSYALRESPQMIHIANEDVIAKIMNGDFIHPPTPVSTANLSREEKRKLRDEKYSLSSQRRRESGRSGPTKERRTPAENRVRQKPNRALSVAPSGRFRKTSGYFKKKLRNQSSSEFSQ